MIAQESTSLVSQIVPAITGLATFVFTVVKIREKIIKNKKKKEKELNLYLHPIFDQIEYLKTMGTVSLINELPQSKVPFVKELLLILLDSYNTMLHEKIIAFEQTKKLDIMDLHLGALKIIQKSTEQVNFPPSFVEKLFGKLKPFYDSLRDAMTLTIEDALDVFGEDNTKKFYSALSELQGDLKVLLFTIITVANAMNGELEAYLVKKNKSK